MIRRFAMVAVVAAALVAGCAVRVPETHLYVLGTGSLAATDIDHKDAAPALVIGDIALPAYLAGSGLVYQTSANEVNVAVNHRWAEPLGQQLRRGLYVALVDRLPAAAVFAQPRAAAQAPWRLRLSLTAFQGHYDGTALISGSWWLRDAAGDVRAGAHFRRRIALQNDGYPALVRALSRGWREVAEIIAQRARTRLIGSDH